MIMLMKHARMYSSQGRWNLWQHRTTRKHSNARSLSRITIHKGFNFLWRKEPSLHKLLTTQDMNLLDASFKVQQARILG